jgi:hypothetical protein
MTVARDGNRVVVADPDRDSVYIVDLVSERLVSTIELAAHSEPGRVIEDGAGRFHVALRGTGELLTITGDARTLQPICGEPRGLAWQASSDLVHVACATGELVSVPPGGGAPVRVLRLERDLRDVVVRSDDTLAVTVFRSAHVLHVDGDVVVRRMLPPVTKRQAIGRDSLEPVDAMPSVAWRTIALPDGSLVMSHQRRIDATLRIVQGGYGGPMCAGSPVESSVSRLGADDTWTAYAPLANAALPVDIAVNPQNGELAVVAAGEQSVVVFSATTQDAGECATQLATTIPTLEIGAPTAVAYRPSGALLTFFPEAGGLTIHDSGVARGITLNDRPQSDAGRGLFHRATAVGLACASCHPEARDDGGVWTFDVLGDRRTQSLGGGILSRAPYHWSADMPTLHALVEDVFTERMAGTPVSPEEERALAAWLDPIPAPRGVVLDSAAVARGQELFDSSELGCKSCHNGTLLTNNRMADVGTGDVFKVPSLIGIGGRAPYLHDGCAKSLRERFTTCGSDNHGRTSQLSPGELDDLVAYLESL